MAALTQEALDAASVEVGARIQAAQDMIHMPAGGEIDPDAVDSEAMLAAFLLWQESKSN